MISFVLSKCSWCCTCKADTSVSWSSHSLGMELETTSIYVIFVTNNIVHCNCHGMALIFRTKVVWVIFSGKTFRPLNISSNLHIRK